MLMLTGCGPVGAVPSSDALPHVAVLDGADEPLRNDFNRDKSFVRLMFLVDPRCPGCLRGLADMGDYVLAKLPKGAPVKVYVVYEPVIGGSNKDIPAAAELLHTTLARHYWNSTGDFGRQMSHALDYWNGSRWIYAWDTWMIYSPDAVWNGSSPPRPAFLMHQLDGLRGNPKFPFLDSKVFAAKVDVMVAKFDEKHTLQ
ncbi:MAG: hypothetical protein JSR55_14870 [Proteobacteria bacterium]|jgi:hypothetical protein|nr:hypothetical protein [Pseudomonadota bacterium]